MSGYEYWLIGAILFVVAVITVIDIQYERRQIARYLRIGGARILKFRWKPFLAWMGADTKSKHYEVTFEEHNGRVIRAIFTYTARLGVMKTSDRIVREPRNSAKDGREFRDAPE